MEKFILTLLKYYAIAGLVVALVAAFWTTLQSLKAQDALRRGHTVNVGGHIFEPTDDCLWRIRRYFDAVGFGMFVMVFTLWPWSIYTCFKNPKFWQIVVIKKKKSAA